MGLGLIAAALVYVLVKDTKPTYSSHTLLNTGLVTGYNLENSGSVRVDMNFAENEMGNLINLSRSNETLEDLCLQLMADFLTEQPSATVPEPLAENRLYLEETKAELDSLNIDFSQKSSVLKENFQHFRNSAGDNALKDLLFSEHPFFGLDYLKKHLQVRQEGRSDLLKVSYTTLDPSICQYTLQQHTALFVEKKMAMKEAQSKSVLEFFEKATRESAEELKTREDDLLAFTVQNKIINYYEQTRYIAAEKEDLDDLYFKERMDRAAFDSSLVRLEKELAGRVNLPKLNGLVDAQRRELGTVSARLTRMETLETERDDKELDLLRNRAQTLKNEMSQSAEAILAVRRTPDGVQLKELLSEWLEKTLQAEITRARLNVFKVRKAEFDETYSRFAPWGSKLKRKEREIDVAERAYLENLHSYNQALLHQFNTTLAGGLKVVDAPAYPAKAQGTNVKMMVAAAFIVVMLLVLSLVIAMEIFDTTLKSPNNASEITGLPLLGALPDMAIAKATNVRSEIVLKNASFHAAQSLLTQLNNQKNQQIGVLSMQENEGVNFATQQLNSVLHDIGAPKKTKLQSLNALCHTDSQDSWNAKMDLVILTASAQRVWTDADRRMLELYRQRSQAPIHLLLTYTNPDYLEETIGEIPRTRSPFRKKMKAVLGKLGIK